MPTIFLDGALLAALRRRLFSKKMSRDKNIVRLPIDVYLTSNTWPDNQSD